MKNETEHPPRCLLVDDEESSRLYNLMRLERMGLKATGASWEEAENAFLKGTQDALILCLRGGEPARGECLERLCALAHGLSGGCERLVVAALDEDSQEEPQCTAAGCDRLVQLPISGQELFQLCRDVTTQSQLSVSP